MATQLNIQFSSRRQQQSARAIADRLAPPYENHGTKTALHPNRVCLVGNTAIIFCRASNGKVLCVRIDREDLVRVLRFGVWRVANFCPRSSRSLYAYSNLKHKIVYLHRFIMDAPPPSAGVEVDHRHRRTLDCRKSELRLVTKSLNQRNRGKFQPNKFGLRGVGRSSNGKRFVARVFFNHKPKILGTFDTPEQAGQAVIEYNRQLGVIA